MRSTASLCVLSFTLAGCMASLTPEGQSVRVVTAAEKDRSCRYLGMVTASESMGAHTAGDAESALNKARNKAARLGANAILLVSTSTNPFNTTVVAEALTCRTTE